jgi:DNA-binding transcriptional LysR family regulator
LNTKLEAIPVLLAAVDTGSIQGAAKQLDLARPTVRRRLETLEAEVGVPLLTRGAQGLRPTAAGEVFATRAREMMAELNGLGRAAREAGASPQGVLRVGIPAGAPPEIVAGMTEAVRGMWPDVRLELISSTTNDDLVTRVDCRFSLELDAPDGQVEVLELGTFREQLVASRSYLESHDPIESVDQIAAHRVFAWIAPDTGTPSRLPTSGPQPRVQFAMATDDLRTLVWLASHGHGLAFMPFEPAMPQPPFPGADEIIPVLPDVVGRDRPRRLVTARAVADTPVVAAFLEQTRAVAAAMFAD